MHLFLRVIYSCILLFKCISKHNSLLKSLVTAMSLPKSARTARLAKEVKSFEIKPPWGITCYPVKEDNFDQLEASVLGPRGSPYESGNFKVSIVIPNRYPFEPPLVKFQTSIYHPNIDEGGRICMDMLKMPPKGSWLPTITLETLLISIQTLLTNPNPDDPLVMDVANDYKYDIEKYIDNARRHTLKYATGHTEATD